MIKNNNSYEISPKKKKQIKDLLYRKWNNDWIKFSNKDEGIMNGGAFMDNIYGYDNLEATYASL